MGKRGPQPSGPEMTVLSTRIQATTRAELDRAAKAKKPKWTLSKEVEYRLRRSFQEDQKITELLGGPQMFAILKMLSAAFETAGGVAYSTRHGRLGASSDWLTDAFAFDQAANAVTVVLEGFRPPGNPKPPSTGAVYKSHGKAAPKKDKRKLDAALSRLGIYAALLEREGVGEAEQALPDRRVSDRQLRFHRISIDLGPLHDTLKKRNAK